MEHCSGIGGTTVRVMWELQSEMFSRAFDERLNNVVSSGKRDFVIPLFLCADLVPFVLKVKAAAAITWAGSEAPQHIREVDGVAIEGYALAPHLQGRHVLNCEQGRYPT